MIRDDDRDSYRRDWREGRRNDWRNGGEGDFSVSLGDVVFGYNDGYYDNGRHWHQWRSDRERDWYSQNHTQTYYRVIRDDDRDSYRRDWREGRRNDWRSGGGEGDFSVSLGNVVFGYNDGYYDNGRRWHQWRSRNERDWYRQNHSQNYYEMRRYRDRDNNRRDWREGRRNDWRVGGGDVNFSISLGNVVYGYSDGYYDNGRQWHSWRNDDERNWYRENHRRSYYDMGREEERDHDRRDWRDGRH